MALRWVLFNSSASGETAPNGANINVTIDNIGMYIRKVIEVTLSSGVQKQMDALIPGQAEINIKRYWLVMIAISPEMRAALKNGYYNHAGDLREWNEQGFSIAVGWSDLSRQGAVGVMAF